MYKSYTVRVGYFTFIPIILTKVTSDSIYPIYIFLYIYLYIYILYILYFIYIYFYISSELILFVCAMSVRGRNDNIEVIV